MIDLLQVARTRRDELRRESRELEDFIRFGEILIEGGSASEDGRTESARSSEESDEATSSGDRAAGAR